MKAQIENILAKELPGFYTEVRNSRIMGSDMIEIRIAAAEWNINSVPGQKPQSVGLMLDFAAMDLHTQSFGCSYGGSIYRDPDMAHPREKYLAMARVKVPFMKPRPNEKAVLSAIERFCKNYKKVLVENIQVLRYRNEIDYSKLLNL